MAADRGVLSGLSAGDRVRLQKAAGQLARPDPDQRRHLRRALARGERESRKARDGSLRRAAGIEVLRRAPRDATPPPVALGVGASFSSSEYGAPRKCYVCKERYLERHHFYDQLCPRCGDENHARRTATADLRGRVPLVTGARVKIGYQAALMLLRAGCRVVSLTRFPRDAAFRYAARPPLPPRRGPATHGKGGAALSGKGLEVATRSPQEEVGLGRHLGEQGRGTRLEPGAGRRSWPSPAAPPHPVA
ncbi:MAG TPA: hypothetical protein VFG53_01960 [Anaeromyxobacter sp.]|nr:hypothetical protein [Anaeromyxobacter sp.]